MFVGVVLNPKARKNRGARPGRTDALRRALGDSGEVVQTATVDDLPAALDRLLPRATHLVSDGGDGALHCLINAVHDRLGPSSERWPVFIPTNGGTIDFVARRAGVRGQGAGIVAQLAAMARQGTSPQEVTLDTLSVEGELTDGAGFHRLGFAIAAGGLGNRFFDKYYDDPEPSAATMVAIIGKTISQYILSQAGVLQSAEYSDHMFRPTYAQVEIDGELVQSPCHSGLHAGSIDMNFAGLIRLFPHARERGTIHFHAGDISPVAIMRNLPRIIAGGSLRGDHLIDAPGSHMRIEATGEVLRPIVDGERYERLRRVSIRVGPSVRVGRVRVDGWRPFKWPFGPLTDSA